jgi:DNA-binding response OmpR family regulator
MLSKQILFVDDDPDWRLIVSDFLGEAGFQVATAADATQAMLEASRTKLDLIVLDLNLAGENGASLLKPLNENQPEARILLYTGLGHDEREIQALLKQGAHRYLRKGTMEELLEGVRDALDFSPQM